MHRKSKNRHTSTCPEKCRLFCTLAIQWSVSCGAHKLVTTRISLKQVYLSALSLPLLSNQSSTFLTCRFFLVLAEGEVAKDKCCQENWLRNVCLRMCDTRRVGHGRPSKDGPRNVFGQSDVLLKWSATCFGFLAVAEMVGCFLASPTTSKMSKNGRRNGRFLFWRPQPTSSQKMSKDDHNIV